MVICMKKIVFWFGVQSFFVLGISFFRGRERRGFRGRQGIDLNLLFTVFFCVGKDEKILKQLEVKVLQNKGMFIKNIGNGRVRVNLGKSDFNKYFRRRI